MHKVGEAANKLIKSTYGLVKINRSNSLEYVKNKVKSLGIIQEQNLNVYVKSNNFKNLVRTDDWILKHPVLAKKINETENTITYKIVTITHSPNDIKLNDNKVEKVIISYYWKNGKLVPQYAPNVSWLIVIDKNDPNVTIKNVMEEPEEMKRVGGQENVEKIIRKLENEWEIKPTYEYINYLKNTVITDYEKYEKNLELAQEQLNKPKPYEE